MSEEDEVFLERSFQRTLIVTFSIMKYFLAVYCPPLGIRETDLILRDSDSCLEEDRGSGVC